MSLEVQCQECRGMTGMNSENGQILPRSLVAGLVLQKSGKKLRHLSLSGTHFHKHHFLVKKSLLADDTLPP